MAPSICFGVLVMRFELVVVSRSVRPAWSQVGVLCRWEQTGVDQHRGGDAFKATGREQIREKTYGSRVVEELLEGWLSGAFKLKR